MSEMVLFDSELKVMEILWQEGSIKAKEVSKVAEDWYGWNKNTTYTILKKLVTKGALRREEPGFVCVPLVSKSQVQKDEAKRLVDKLYEGSSKMLLSAFIKDESLSKEELKSLRDLIDKEL